MAQITVKSSRKGSRPFAEAAVSRRWSRVGGEREVRARHEHLHRRLPLERRRRVFTPSAAAFVESGRALAAVAAREGWQVLDENPSLLNDALIAASCREQGITLIAKDGDFERLEPFLKGLRHVAPWP